MCFVFLLLTHLPQKKGFLWGNQAPALSFPKPKNQERSTLKERRTKRTINSANLPKKHDRTGRDRKARSTNLTDRHKISEKRAYYLSQLRRKYLPAQPIPNWIGFRHWNTFKPMWIGWDLWVSWWKWNQLGLGLTLKTKIAWIWMKPLISLLIASTVANNWRMYKKQSGRLTNLAFIRFKGVK